MRAESNEPVRAFLALLEDLAHNARTADSGDTWLHIAESLMCGEHDRRYNSQLYECYLGALLAIMRGDAASSVADAKRIAGTALANDIEQFWGPRRKSTAKDDSLYESLMKRVVSETPPDGNVFDSLRSRCYSCFPVYVTLLEAVANYATTAGARDVCVRLAQLLVAHEIELRYSWKRNETLIQALVDIKEKEDAPTFSIAEAKTIACSALAKYPDSTYAKRPEHVENLPPTVTSPPESEANLQHCWNCGVNMSSWTSQMNRKPLCAKCREGFGWRDGRFQARPPVIAKPRTRHDKDAAFTVQRRQFVASMLEISDRRVTEEDVQTTFDGLFDDYKKM
jgi:hypothetical protein